MRQAERFKEWLGTVYVSEKTKRHLSSVQHYAIGISTLSRKLSLPGNGIYDITDIDELKNLKDIIIKLPSRTKDELSHFRAYLKFKEIEIRDTTVIRQPDKLKKQQVEIAAINMVTDHFTDLGYKVNSREKDNLGWDLEASNQGETFLLEVKGLSGIITVIELTPNEYQKSNERKTQFKLCIVTNALLAPHLEIFRFDLNLNCWINDNNEKLVIEKRTGARMQKEH